MQTSKDERKTSDDFLWLLIWVSAMILACFSYQVLQQRVAANAALVPCHCDVLGFKNYSASICSSLFPQQGVDCQPTGMIHFATVWAVRPVDASTDGPRSMSTIYCREPVVNAESKCPPASPFYLQGSSLACWLEDGDFLRFQSWQSDINLFTVLFVTGLVFSVAVPCSTLIRGRCTGDAHSDP